MCHKKGKRENCKKEKGDDTMSAVATNCVYQVIVKSNSKPEPQISSKKLEAIKASVEKYFRDK